MFQRLRNINYEESVNVDEETTCMNIKNVNKIINSFIRIKNPIQTPSQEENRNWWKRRQFLLYYTNFLVTLVT